MNNKYAGALAYLFMLVDTRMVVPLVLARRIDLLKYMDANLDFCGSIMKIAYYPHMWGDDYAKPPGVWVVGVSVKGEDNPNWYGFADAGEMKDFVRDESLDVRGGRTTEIVIRYVELKTF